MHGDTGTKVTHKLTLLALDNDCNAGFDLDDCDGYTCVAGSINDASEGLMGHDNGLASIAMNVEELAMINLTGVQQALNDSLCGLTDDIDMGFCSDGTCSVAVGTACAIDSDCPTDETCNDATACTSAGSECTAPATCDFDDDDCGAEIPPLELFFDVEANAAAGCANVIVRSVGLCSDSGTCSATVATTCAFDSDCPATETCTGAMTCEADATCDPGTCLGGGTSEPSGPESHRPDQRCLRRHRHLHRHRHLLWGRCWAVHQRRRLCRSGYRNLRWRHGVRFRRRTVSRTWFAWAPRRAPLARIVTSRAAAQTPAPAR